jgi:hypothetical protein
MEILNPNEWRISKSGFSIRTGWADEKKIIAKYPGALSPIDNAEFQTWLDNAQTICDAHNSALAKEESCPK